MNLNFQKIFTRIITILIILLLIYAIYLTEKNLIISPIYLLLKVFSIILHIYSEKIKTFLIIISCLIAIVINIIILQTIILSIIFLSGGLFARFIFHDNFKSFIIQQKKLAKESIDSLNFPINDPNQNFIFSISKIQSFQKAYNKLKMANNSTFEIKQSPFGEYLNEIIFQFSKYEEENYDSEETKKNLIDNLKSYQEHLELYKNFSFIDIIIKFEYYKTLQLFDELLYNSFEGRICNSKTISDNFNVYIISPKITNSEVKTLVVFCGANAFNVELFSFSQNSIKFYINIKQTTILLWNYKGYGLRSGFTTFRNIDKDVRLLHEFINNNYNDYKIIIHGISIGGYPAIKLAKSLGDNKNICLIADRTYADIDLIAQEFIENGQILKNIYNILFPKFLYESNNVQNYIDLPIRNKFILYDENDKIILYNPSSLIYNLTKKYYNEILLPKISDYKQYKNLTILSFKEEFKNLLVEIKSLKRNYSLNEFTLDLINALIINSKNFDDFLIYFLVFAYPFNKLKEINYNKKIFAENYIELPLLMKKMNKSDFSNNLINFISDINFLFIKCNLIIPFNDDEIVSFNYNNDQNEFILQEGFQDNIIKYFGYVHRVSCGHNGALNDKDEQYLKLYFESNEFISDSNDDENINVKEAIDKNENELSITVKT